MLAYGSAEDEPNRRNRNYKKMMDRARSRFARRTIRVLRVSAVNVVVLRALYFQVACGCGFLMPNCSSLRNTVGRETASMRAVREMLNLVSLSVASSS
jgi:hypothetical protein